MMKIVMVRKKRCVQQNEQCGAMFIALALLFALVGILFGLGRLKAHEYQVARRFERTYQVEKMLAVRNMEALVRTTGKPIKADNVDDSLFYNFYTNEWVSANSGETLVCTAIPTPFKEYQSMNPTNFYKIWRWIYQGDPAEVDIQSEDGSMRPGVKTAVAIFSVNQAVSNVLYRGAMIQNTGDSWLKNPFGYLYSLDVQSAEPKLGFGRIFLYLVGAENSVAQGVRFESNYEVEKNKHSWIRMELMRSSTADLTATNANACRNLAIHRGGGSSITEGWTNILAYDPIAYTADALVHAGGLLLSRNKMVGFGSSSTEDLLFSYPAVDLNQYVNTNDFANVWVFIENEFARYEDVEKLDGGTNDFAVLVDKFTIKEPTTYTISVYNKKIEPLVNTNKTIAERQIATWCFQTHFPDSGAGKQGKQLLIDTYGVEPVSLWRERRGQVPE